MTSCTSHTSYTLHTTHSSCTVHAQHTRLIRPTRHTRHARHAFYTQDTHTSHTSHMLHTRHTHVSHVTHVTRHTHVTHTSAHLFNQLPSRHSLQCSQDASLVYPLRLVREIDESCGQDSDCEWGTVGSSCGNEEVCVCDETTNGATMRVENYGGMSYCYEFSQGQDCAVPEECLSK